MLDLARKLIPPSLQPIPKRPRVVKSAGEGRTKKFFHLRETTAARDTLISPQRRRRHRKNGFSPPSPPSVPPSFPLWDEADDDVTNLLKLLALHTRSLSFHSHRSSYTSSVCSTVINARKDGKYNHSSALKNKSGMYLVN